MGAVAGEKVARTLERAAEMGVPAIVFCASGGARMQEGLLSLMQMAKTTATVERCREAGVPHLIRRTGPFLYEVAEWCQERNLPPINALVVLDDEGVPGDSYAEAPGCSLVNWVDEAERVIQERRYPEEI